MNATSWITFVNRRRPSRSGSGLAVVDVKAPRSILGHTAPTIAVRLRNSGSGPVVITGCAAEVLWARRFPHVRPPVARAGHRADRPLPVPAHEVVVVPRPEEAAGCVFPGERGCARGVAAGEPDRFVVRLEPEEHGGGTDFAHALPGDDRLAYQVRLRIRYTEGRRKRELRTAVVGVISPANLVIFPAPGEIAESITRFRREAACLAHSPARHADSRCHRHPADLADPAARFRWNAADLGDSAAREPGTRPSGPAGPADGPCGPPARTVPPPVRHLGRLPAPTPAVRQPEPAIAAYLADLAALCRSVLADLPAGSDLARTHHPAARRTLTETRGLQAP